MVNKVKDENKVDTFMGFIIKAVIICILFENMQIVSIMGAGFKPLHIVLVLCIFRQLILRPLKTKSLLLGILFLFIPALPLYRINDIMEWFKTYIIYVILVLFFATSLEPFCRTFAQNKVGYVKLLMRTIAISQILGVIQFIMMNFFGVFFLKDIFGPFAFHACQFGMFGSFYRAYSIFFEPSFFAWVCNIALTVVLYCGNSCFSSKEKYWYLGLSLVALFCSLSSSGIIIGMIILIAKIILFSKDAFKLFLICMVTVLAAIFLWFFTDLLLPIKRLFTEIETENTSGYERLVTPLLYIARVFEHFPVFGRGIGQEGNVDVIGIIGLYSGVHNSLFGIIVHFGLTSLAFYVPAIIYSIRRVANNRQWLLLLIGLAGIYISTGAFISVDTFLFLILILAVGYEQKSNTSGLYSA